MRQPSFPITNTYPKEIFAFVRMDGIQAGFPQYSRISAGCFVGKSQFASQMRLVDKKNIGDRLIVVSLLPVGVTTYTLDDGEPSRDLPPRVERINRKAYIGGALTRGRYP